MEGVQANLTSMIGRIGQGGQPGAAPGTLVTPGQVEPVPQQGPSGEGPMQM